MEFDRTRKQALYARNGVEGYWILNIEDQALEVYRAPRGDNYQDRRTLEIGGRSAPLHAGRQTVRVSDLLP